MGRDSQVGSDILKRNVQEYVGKAFHHFLVAQFCALGDERIDTVLGFDEHFLHHAAAHFLPAIVMIVQVFQIVFVNNEKLAIGDGLDDFEGGFL